MGYSGMLNQKLKAQELRKKGLSYSEILSKIKVSKDTVSRWCRDIELTAEQKNRLYVNKAEGGVRGSIIGAKMQQDRKEKEIYNFKIEGIKEVGVLSKRDRFLVGIALYLAEGTKQDRKCEFTNADPRLIKFMVNWFREFGKVDEKKLRGAIWIHENLDSLRAKSFWSKLTNIPQNQFHKTYIAENKVNSLKIRKNIHLHGVFSIRFVDAKLHRKIAGWSAGIVE